MSGDEIVVREEIKELKAKVKGLEKDLPLLLIVVKVLIQTQDDGLNDGTKGALSETLDSIVLKYMPEMKQK